MTHRINRSLRTWVAPAAVVLAAALCSALPVRAQTAWVAHSAMPPGALWMQAMAVNDHGDLVGGLAWAAGGGGGFTYRNGQLQMLAAPPGALSTSPTGISNGGVLVGSYVAPGTGGPNELRRVPFLWENGAYTDLVLPGASNVEARSISSDGRYVSGWYNRTADSRFIGYLYDRSTGSVVGTVDPGAGATLLNAGVNRHGQMVGSINRPGARVGYVFDLASGQCTEFSFANVLNLSPRGINDSGQIAGWMGAPGAANSALSSVGWTGSATGYQVVAPGIEGWGAVLQGMNNHGQVAGYYSSNRPGDSIGTGFIVTPAALPAGPGPEPFSHRFDIAVRAGQPVFIDPTVAVGYRYAIGNGDPRFASVSLPLGIGDNLFTVLVGSQAFTVGGHQIFDFTAHGFDAGVDSFQVLGIEPEAMLDPLGQGQFVTRLTFTGDGRFTGTQTALTFELPAVPEPQTALLLTAGVMLLVAWGRRGPQRR